MHIHFEIMLCLGKGLSLLDEDTEQFENTNTTQLNTVVGRIPKTHKSVNFGYLTKKQLWFMDHKYTAAASQQTH